MKLLMLILVFDVLAMQGFGQDPMPSDCQFSTIIQVDGQADEWPLKWLEDDDKNFNYNICTDESNIYVRLRVNEAMVKRKLGMFGLTLWMDPGGKKKKKLGLRFPTGSEGTERMTQYRLSSASEDFKTMSSSEKASFQKELEKALISNVELMELIGLTDEPLTSTRSGITNGIKVAIAVDSAGAYVYEAIVPFKSYRLSKSKLSSLGIGFETGSFKAPPKAQKGGGSGTATAPGQNSTGSYGTRFSASNMAVGQGYQGNRGPMAVPTSFWMSIKFKN